MILAIGFAASRKCGQTNIYCRANIYCPALHGFFYTPNENFENQIWLHVIKKMLNQKLLCTAWKHCPWGSWWTQSVNRRSDTLLILYVNATTRHAIIFDLWPWRVIIHPRSWGSLYPQFAQLISSPRLDFNWEHIGTLDIFSSAKHIVMKFIVHILVVGPYMLG